jgi:hypothetical protein
LELDDNFKRLIDQLGHAINESLSESDEVADVMARIRESGYDLFLILEVTIGFNKRGETDLARTPRAKRKEPREARFRLTNQDAEFLRALKITIDEEPH